MLKNKRDEILTRFTKLSMSTSFHCYPKIFRSINLTSRLIWSIFFAVFFSLTCHLFIRDVFQYLEYDVVSKIRVFNEKSSPFPTVTICDANPFNSKEAEAIIQNSSKVYDSEFLDRFGLRQIEKSLIRTEYYKNFIMSQAFTFTDEQKRKLGFSVDQIQSCYFNEIECSNEDFYWFFSYEWGSCYQFNSGKNTTSALKETKLGGRNYGLGLFIGPLESTNKYPTYHSTGLRIFVHNNSFLSSSADEILVETGKHSSIAIKKTFTHKTPTPYSECQELTHYKSELYDYIRKNNLEYRQKDCFELCLQKMISDNCSCFYTWLPVFGDSSQPCTNFKQFKCLALKFEETIDEIETICAPQCPLECDFITYELSMSSLSYPNKQFYDSLGYNSSEMTFNKYRETHLGVDIFLPKKQYTEISETPKITFVDLVSSIGGALGVFLGLSVFSFIEIFEIIICILFSLCKGLANNNNNKNKNSNNNNVL